MWRRWPTKQNNHTSLPTFPDEFESHGSVKKFIPIVSESERASVELDDLMSYDIDHLMGDEQCIKIKDFVFYRDGTAVCEAEEFQNVCKYTKRNITIGAPRVLREAFWYMWLDYLSDMDDLPRIVNGKWDNFENFQHDMSLINGYDHICQTNWPLKFSSFILNHGACIDQISNIRQDLIYNPDSRRIILNGWNPELLPDETLSHDLNVGKGNQVLPPCHLLTQFLPEKLNNDERENLFRLKHSGYPSVVTEEDLNESDIPTYRLNMQMYQRSADVPVGVPFNIAGYSLLLHLMARESNMTPGTFVWTGADVHIYSDQIEDVKKLLERRDSIPPLPKLHILEDADDIFNIQPKDIEILEYDPLSDIKMNVTT